MAAHGTGRPQSTQLKEQGAFVMRYEKQKVKLKNTSQKKKKKEPFNFSKNNQQQHVRAALKRSQALKEITAGTAEGFANTSQKRLSSSSKNSVPQNFASPP